MTTIKRSMMAAAISAAAIFGIIAPASAKTIIRPGGNVVRKQLYDSAGKPVNCLPARETAQDAVPQLQGRKQV